MWTQMVKFINYICFSESSFNMYVPLCNGKTYKVIKNISLLVTMVEANVMYYSCDAYSILKENTISSNRLRVISKLASGQFGQVYKGN